MYVGGRLFGGGAFINNTWQNPGRLFGRGVFLREGRLFEQIRYLLHILLQQLTIALQLEVLQNLIMY